MKDILEIIKFAKEQNLRFNKNLILTIIGSAIEVITLSTFIPLIYLIIDFENIQKLFEKINFITFDYDIVFYKLIVLLVILIFTIGTLLVFLIRYIVSNNLNKFSSYISYNIFKVYLENNYEEIISQKAAGIYNLVSSETNRFCNGLIRSLFELISRFFIFLFIVSGLLIYNFKITALTIVVGIVIYLVIYSIFKGFIRKYNENIDKITTHDNNFLRTGTQAILELRVYSIAEKFLNSFQNNLLKKNKFGLNLETIKQSPKYIIEIGIIVTFSFLIFLDINLINNNLAKFAIYLVAFYKLFPTFNQFFNYYVSFKSHLKSLNSIKNIIQKKQLIDKKIYFNRITKLDLVNVNFNYKNDNKFKLKDFNLSISEGDNIAIIGETGSGKTTLLHMLMGLLVPNKGNLIINENINYNLKYFTSLIKNVSYINQNPFFFEDTILKNICLKDELSVREQDKFNKIEEIVFGEHFLNKFEKGFSTILDTSGLNLSTGQRQRVNLARGLFKEHSVIFMDEPTSALDYETEKEILKKIFSSKLIKTTVIATHRKSILDYCNKIVEI